MNAALDIYFDVPYAGIGEGGAIPLVGVLGEKFLKAQFLTTGVPGPESNAHGPNEFLHVSFAQKLTCAMADVIANLP